MQLILKIDVPILPGSISTAKSRCGKSGCACKARKPKLHGPYYRWTGFINGKRTTKTISKEVAVECERRIARYERVRRQIDEITAQALDHAPWTDRAG